MLKRIYIDNFRCFSNFELKLKDLQLLLGSNGAGKSSLMVLLYDIQRLIAGDRNVDDVFQQGSATAWGQQALQTVELDVVIDKDEYKYRLEVERDAYQPQCHIAKESLAGPDGGVFIFEDGEVTMPPDEDESYFHDLRSFKMDRSRSALATLRERSNDAPMSRFQRELRNWIFLSIQAPMMEEFSQKENARLQYSATNFCDWYRHIVQEQPNVTNSVFASLKEAILGFRTLRLSEAGAARQLSLQFKREGKSYAHSVRAASDGQRCLVVLYTVLNYLRENGGSLFIDEPDNYLALREIAPWMAEVEELCDEGEIQAVVASHHPEIVNSLAMDRGLWFHRPDNGPVQVKDYPIVEGLTPAETMARGWDDG